MKYKSNIQEDDQYIKLLEKNVGIGTTNPDEKLEVAGDGQQWIKINNTNNAGVNSIAGIKLFANNTYRSALYFDDNAGVTRLDTAVGTAQSLVIGGTPLIFNTSGTERMRILSDGNVGIGTTSLTNSSGYTTLSISGSTGGQIAFQTSGTGKHYIYSSATDFNIYNSQAGNLKLFTNSTERINIDSAGAIKFNSYNSTNQTGTPTYLLGTDASGNIVKTNTVPGSAAGPYLPVANPTFTGTLTGPTAVINSTTSNDYRSNSDWYGTSSGFWDFRSMSGGASKMRISSTGNVGIGTTTPQSKLQVAGGIQMADDTATASAAKVGTNRYRVSGNNSYVDVCMQTGAATYAWVNIVQNNW